MNFFATKQDFLTHFKVDFTWRNFAHFFSLHEVYLSKGKFIISSHGASIVLPLKLHDTSQTLAFFLIRSSTKWEDCFNTRNLLYVAFVCVILCFVHTLLVSRGHPCIFLVSISMKPAFVSFSFIILILNVLLYEVKIRHDKDLSKRYMKSVYKISFRKENFAILSTFIGER